MIKPVTFQGAENFKANLYALEVRSRFVDQSAANGYYAGYGNELAATVSSNVISIGTGAFLVQGRLIEVETAESLSVVIQNGKYGLVIARIETRPATNTANCSLVVRTGNSISALLSGLTQENTYQYAAETTNKVYELPLYNFYMTGGAITITEKVVSEIKEITEIKQKADTAVSTANSAVSTANTAKTTANTAKTTANSASTAAATAQSTADTAQSTATAASNAAATAQSTANTANAKATANESEIATIKTRLDNLGFRQGSISGTNISNATLTRQGNYVIGKFTASGSFSFTLPVNFRPKTTVTSSVGTYYYDSSGRVYRGGGGTITFNTNGSVSCEVKGNWQGSASVCFGFEASPIT